MRSNVTTAIIPVAGFGSRMLPVVKAVEKCMLPILNRPIIDYVVQDCISAGIKHIIFIVSRENSQVKQFYSRSEMLETYLRLQGKESLLETIAVPRGVEFTYLVQDQNGAYGSAIPVALTYPYVKNQNQVLVLMGDDFIWNEDGSSEYQRLIKASQDSKEAVLLGVPMSSEEISRYGVIKINEAGFFQEIIEKPQPLEAPSNLINISKYLIPSSLMQYIYDYTKEEMKEGEYMITEPINRWVKDGGLMRVQAAKGKYLDGGNPHSWLYANNYLARHNV